MKQRKPLTEPVIRPSADSDADSIWAILEPTIRAGETYALPAAMSRKDALAYWFSVGHQVFVIENDDHQIVASYFLTANHQGGGAHVANCGYMVASDATGQGLATQMCRHSMILARSQGFRAMQFNFVVSTNDAAVKIWTRLGFEIVGRLPLAFLHPKLGFVDALVMYQLL